jgi:hypothetical protein
LGCVDHATRGEQASTVSATRCFNLEKDDEASLAQLKIAQLFKYDFFFVQNGKLVYCQKFVVNRKTLCHMNLNETEVVAKTLRKPNKLQEGIEDDQTHQYL